LEKESGGEGDLESLGGGEPAAKEVGEDATKFVEEEEVGKLDYGEASVMEVQEHEHAEGAIGESEAPVGGGDEGVSAGMHKMNDLTIAEWTIGDVWGSG
jgi:hypothetical protein